MKFVVRRLIAGIVSIPFVAGAYVFLYLTLLLLGAEPNQTISETFFIGSQIGFVFALILVFYPQFSKFVNKLV